MQTILDDLQSDVQDELEKVSLERLASIDPDLLVKIKSTAEDALRNGGASNSGVPANAAPEQDEIPSFLVDTRSATAIKYTKTWENLKIDPLKESHDIIAGLRHVVIEVSKSDSTYTQKEAIGMTNALGAAGAMAGVLTTTLERIRDVEKKAKSIASSDGATKISSSGAVARGFFAIDKSLFTSDGIKTKNMAVVGMLYEIGLPFTSTGDGRRFATQWELSNHLDALFKKK
jgi:pre-mRNA cleavage complex 2 protein Pcf11